MDALAQLASVAAPIGVGASGNVQMATAVGMGVEALLGVENATPPTAAVSPRASGREQTNDNTNHDKVAT